MTEQPARDSTDVSITQVREVPGTCAYWRVVTPEGKQYKVTTYPDSRSFFLETMACRQVGSAPVLRQRIREALDRVNA